MKKRLLSMLLVLTLVLSMVPVAVLAEEVQVTATPKAGTHTDAHKCEECGAAFEEWTGTDSLPGTGHYYLTGDVTLTAERQVTGELHLCLNGYVIKAAANKRIFNTKGDTATELVITDCTAYTDAEDVYHAGALTGGLDKSAGGGAAFIRRMGVMKVYDGRITGNTSTVAGGAVALQARSGSVAAGQLYMYGGELSNNTAQTADGTYKNGGAVYTGNGSVVELTNVRISGNTAIAGGAIYTGAMASAILLTDCVIENNTATGTEGGGVIYSTSASFRLTGCTVTGNKAPNGSGSVIWAKTSGDFQLTDCQVTGNQAKNAGGVARLQDKVNLTSDGSSFTENKAGSGGSVLYYQNYCQVVLKDTTITGNTGTSTSSAGYSAAIYGVGGSSKLTVGGKTVIADNTVASPNTADINFNNAATDTLYVDGLTAGSRIFFSTKATTEAAAADLVSGTPSDWDFNWVTFMDENGQLKMIGYEDGEFVFSKGHAHNACGDPACTDHAELSYKAWTDSTSLPASGSWYLATDVTVTGEKRLAGTLDLCLNGHTITGQTGNTRIYSTTADKGHVLNISDCTATTVGGVYTAGKITGSHNTNTGAGGGAIFLRAGSTMRLFDGIICDNSTVAGGGALYANASTVEMYGGVFTGNKAQNAEGTWKTGGGIYLQNSGMTLYGGQIFGNEANDGAGIHVSGSSFLDMRGGSITENIAYNEAAGVYVASAGAGIALSGNVQITGNVLANGMASNLQLRDGQQIRLGQLTADALVGVTATAFRPFTQQTEDQSARFSSDDVRFAVVHQNGALQLEATGDHKHCLCTGTAATGCDHGALTFAPWEDPTALPASGNYYLTVDVTVAARTNLENTTLRLCLNGHTITVGDQGGRVFRMYSGAHLYLTDCAPQPGIITGATQGAILSDQEGTDMSIDFWRIAFSGNHCKGSGGAIIAQGDTTVNMYSGKITDNSSEGYLKTDAEGKVLLDAAGNQSYVSGYGAGLLLLGNSTFHMYGGEISGNRAVAVAYVKADGTTASGGGQGGGIFVRGTANLYGGVIRDNTAHVGGGVAASGANAAVNLLGTQISGNSAVSGGGVILQSKAKSTMTAGKISGNTVSDSGAGVYLSTGTALDMTGGEISGNLAAKNGGGVAASGKETRLSVKNASVSGNKAKNAGGIYTQTYARLELHTGSQVAGNYASSSGGGVYSATNAVFVMTGGTVTGNSTDGDVGGVMCLRGTAQITGGTISNNQGANTGGLKIYGTNASISGLSITGNRAIGKPSVNAAGKVTYSGGSGCGLMVAASSYTKDGVKTDYIPVVNINGIYIANNQANGSAAGVLVQSKGVQFNMQNATLEGNKAATGGGGAMYIASNVNATLKNLKVTGNQAVTAGGINLYGCTVDADGLVVTGNQSTKGGAGITVVAKTAKVTMKNARISDNTAGGAGGGLVVQTSATLWLADSQISGNTSTSLGGGVYFSSPSWGTFQNVEISENKAERDGGGINLYANCELTMEQVTVRDNVSDTAGGGIFCRGRLAAENCKFLNNRAAEGGAIATSKSAGDTLRDRAGAFVESSVISGNASTGKGGAIYNHRGGPVYLTDCMITDNSSAEAGSAVYADGRLGLTDVTVTGNCAENDGYAVYVSSAEYDGHTYIAGHKKLGGNVIVKDNQGGDMFLCEGAILAVTGEQLGEKTHVAVTIPGGVLAQYVQGVYGYEGGDLHYIITAGNRSVTDPERAAETEEQTTDAPQQSGETVLLYVAVAAAGLLAIGGAVLVILKKKRSAAAEKK